MPWEILSITEGTTLDPDTLRFKAMRIVRFKVGTHGPFTLQVPEEKFTEAYIREQLDETARRVNALAPPKAAGS